MRILFPSLGPLRVGWKKLNGVKQGCPLSHTLFGIYIDNIEEILEDARM